MARAMFRIDIEVPSEFANAVSKALHEKDLLYETAQQVREFVGGDDPDRWAAFLVFDETGDPNSPIYRGA